MSSWADFQYRIASKPTDPDIFELGDDTLRTNIVMALRGAELAMEPSDAVLMKCGVEGIEPSDSPNFYTFNGDRDELDEWATANYPHIDYEWVESFHMSFATKAAKAALDRELGSRLLEQMRMR